LAITSDPEVMRYIGAGRPFDEEQTLAFIERQIKHEAEHGYCLWSLVERDTGQLVGQSGIKHMGDTGLIEIGWWIRRSHWGRKLATEAARRVVRFAFDEAHLERIIAIAQPTNVASIAIMRKLGMRFDRNARHGDLGLKNPDIPIVIYSLSSADAKPYAQ
jgi:ribosomal-protein-alanine N-acetyltransferase